MNRWDMELADTRQAQKLRQRGWKDHCPYCGAKVRAGQKACAAHRDLPALDPGRTSAHWVDTV